MKKLLLINPAFNISREKYDTSISVGLLCLASYLENKGWPVEIIDCARQPQWRRILEKELPGVGYVGFSAMTTQIPAAFAIAREVREKYPEIKLIWGGPHVSFFPEESLEHELVDFVVLYEGEAAFDELLGELQKESLDLLKIKGLGYKKRDKVLVNEKRELLSMDQIPLPNWDLMPKEILERLDLVPTHTSRGCPHRCSFCINAITKNRWRQREPKKVLKDLAIIKSKPYFAGKKLRFWDENFFVDLGRVKKIVEGMIEKDLIIPWETTIRIDYIFRPEMTAELLYKIKQSGCYLFSFGAESGSQRVLDKINKDIEKEQILQSAKICLKYDIIPQYSFMVGLPGEERRDISQTIDLIDRLINLDPRVQVLGPQAFRPYPSSPLYKECIRAGWKAPRGLEQWSEAVKNEMSYMAPRNFPWVKDPGLVESLEAYARFGAQTWKSALGSTITSNKLLKIIFILACKIRWKLRFFKWPFEYKLAKKYISSEHAL